MLGDGELMVDIFASLGRVMAGFIFAAIIGIPVGIAMGTFYSMDSPIRRVCTNSPLYADRRFCAAHHHLGRN